MKAVIFLAVVIFACVVPCQAKENEFTIKISADGVSLNVEWEDNKSVEALRKILPLTVEMSAYGGFEQVGSLGSGAKSLPRNDSHMTAKPGDIMLYSGNQIVIFHGNNSWAYTRLGKITGKSQAELSEIFDKPGVTLKIFAE